MSHPSLRRSMATTAALAAGLTTVVAGALTTPTAAAPSTVGVHLAAAAPEASAWFVDPRTPAQRRAQIAVPHHPERVAGKARETRAAYRTGDGALAVPVRYAFGNTVEKGQALTLDGDGLFAANTATLTKGAHNQLRQLAGALSQASSIRCEGYADYARPVALRRTLARERSAAVCAQLVRLSPGLAVSTVNYGPRRPAVVGGRPTDRRLNRRVVVEMTGTRPSSPQPPAAPEAKRPGAPVLQQVVSLDGGVSYAFSAPASDGGSPITGYEVSLGDAWHPVAGSVRAESVSSWLEGEILGLQPGTTVTVRVRAVNAVGTGDPSNSLSTLVHSRPSAPTNLTVTGVDGVITATFGAPTSDGGRPVTAYEISYDGGETWLPTILTGTAPWTVTDEGFENGTSYDVRVRAINEYGPGAGASVGVSLPAGPEAYRGDYYYYNGGATLAINLFFTTYDGALKYEARLDDGAWLPIDIRHEQPGSAYATMEDPVCGAPGVTCTGDRTVVLRAVLPEGGYSPVGKSFVLTEGTY